MSELHIKYNLSIGEFLSIKKFVYNYLELKITGYNDDVNKLKKEILRELSVICASNKGGGMSYILRRNNTNLIELVDNLYDEYMKEQSSTMTKLHTKYNLPKQEFVLVKKYVYDLIEQKIKETNDFEQLKIEVINELEEIV